MKKLLLFLLYLYLSISRVQAFSSSAYEYVLMDMDTGRVLASKNMNSPRLIASTTKIMTAIVTLENIDVNKKIIVSDNVLKSYGSGIYIKPGEELTILDLLYGLMLRSGNDAAIELAYQVSGSMEQFVLLMNKKADALGMNNTNFINSHGLDEEKSNYSTAYDMAVLTSYAMKNEMYRKIVATKKYTLKTNMNYYSWINKNKLLFMSDYITGGKTGYTVLAHRTLVSTASKDNINLVCVTLNDGNDFNDHNNLYKEAFDNYVSYKILKKGYIDVLGDNFYEDFKLYIKNDFNYLLNKNDNNQIVLKILLEQNNNFKIGDKVGTIEIYLGDEFLNQEEIYVDEKKKSNLLFWDKLKRFFK